jgi:hypothetical protein
MSAHLTQRRSVSDSPTLEEQVTGFLFGEHGWAVVTVRLGIDCDED